MLGENKGDEKDCTFRLLHSEIACRDSYLCKNVEKYTRRNSCGLFKYCHANCKLETALESRFEVMLTSNNSTWQPAVPLFAHTTTMPVEATGQ